MTRIALYSVAPILAKGLESILRRADGFELLPCCTTVDGFIQQMTESAPDVVLLELTPDVTFALLSDMRRRAPGAKIVLWVNSVSTEMALQAMELGIRGILRKSLPADLQLKCLQRVHAGDVWFEKALTERVQGVRRVSLTTRESQLVALLSQGLRNKEIADVLSISDGTVKVYLSRLFQKLEVKDRFELALFGLKNLNSLPQGLNHGAALPVPGPSSCLRSLVIDRGEDSEDAPKATPFPFVPTMR